jgi:cathepsin A (carboxypeptidase C)
MRLLASSALIGAAAAAMTFEQHRPQQQPLQTVPDKQKSTPGTWAEPMRGLKEQWNGLTAEVREAWDEVAMLFPEAMAQASILTPPKKHARRPNSHWDHIVKGADIQSVWIENAKGEQEREIDGKLEDYSMRIKKVDPSSLGVDPDVKQYSGYLDDEQNDKHLFYCKLSMRLSSTAPLTPAS